jgi:hypothetical protein
MHARAGPLVPLLFTAPALLTAETFSPLLSFLSELHTLFQDLRAIFAHTKVLVDPQVFYHTYRPMLGGWFPNGIVLEPTKGLAEFENAIPEAQSRSIVRFKGPSAGQSTIFIVFDDLLGIKHGEAMVEFQHEMLEYMPTPHRQFVFDLRKKFVFGIFCFRPWFSCF